MNTDVLNSLMDAAGAPSHPLIFLVLGVVTFALHMVAVNLMLGTLGTALWGSRSSNPHAQRLTHSLIMTAKVAVGFAVVLGVAPLLFVQVVYDGFWYVSNVLSAWWLIIFVLVLIVAYLGLYRAYDANHIYAEDGRPLPLHGAVKGCGWLLISFVLLLLCGLIMHALSNQALFPNEWMAWYAPNGVVSPEGRSLHYALLPRLGFFLSLSLPVTAGWLYGLRRYLLNSGETDMGYITFVEGLATRIALVGGILVALFAIWWMIALPESMQWFRTSIWAAIAAIPLLYFLAMAAIQKKRRLCSFCNYMAFLMSLVMVMVLAAMREVLRYGTLFREFSWDALNYPFHMDWGTTIVFFTTFLVIGALNISYLITLAWKSGQQQGTYTPSPAINQLGSAAVLSLVAWVIGYFVVGYLTI